MHKGIPAQRWSKDPTTMVKSKQALPCIFARGYFQDSSPDLKDDHSYILPVLLRFDGQPEVDDEESFLNKDPFSSSASIASNPLARRSHSLDSLIELAARNLLGRLLRARFLSPVLAQLDLLGWLHSQLISPKLLSSSIDPMDSLIPSACRTPILITFFTLAST
ncbi:hypothetical protein KSP40_PGU014011 [Platanthera guangdongensis]|uniref:Uncharacterized protein n=1 Tax=Platanthera guangdongensis TaxID=2320717 RepID=A0ABR2MJN3_9ASPA